LGAGVESDAGGSDGGVEIRVKERDGRKKRKRGWPHRHGDGAGKEIGENLLILVVLVSLLNVRCGTRVRLDDGSCGISRSCSAVGGWVAGTDIKSAPTRRRVERWRRIGCG
jgi:hypothetical protein